MSRYRLATAAIVLLGALLRFWSLDGGLPHPLTRPDEERVLAEAAAPARGEFDLRYAVYPGAYIYLTWAWCEAGLSVGSALGFFPDGSYREAFWTHRHDLILVARSLSAIASTLTIALVLGSTRAALGMPAALVAGTLLATNVLHVRDAHAAKPDALLTLGVAAALACMPLLARRDGLLSPLRVGTTIGLASGMKYPAMILLGPAWLASVLGSARVGWRRLLPGRFVAVALAAAAVFVLTSPYLFVNPETRRVLLGLFGSIFRDLFPTLAPEIPDSLAALAPERSWWSGYAYHIHTSLRYGIGLAATVLALPAVAWGFVSQRPFAIVAAAWVVVYFAIHGLSSMILARYMTPLLPGLVVLEAGMVTAALARVGAAWRSRAIGVALALLVAEPFVGSVAYDRIMGRTDTRVLATEWLQSHASPGSTIAVAGTVFWSYGEPTMPPGMAQIRLEAGATTLPPEAEFLLTHDHPTFASTLEPGTLAPFAARLRLLVDLDPFIGDPTEAIFEHLDAYYVPLGGYAAVYRPGPHIQIYAIDG